MIPAPAATSPPGCGPAAGNAASGSGSGTPTPSTPSLFVGLLPAWYPPNYDCGACGYATCAVFLHHTKTLRSQSDDLEFTGPVCNLRDVDLGIAVGSPKPPP